MIKIKDNEFKCATCGNIYEKGWSDVDAIEEALNKFGDELLGECNIVCDDCYNL